MYVFSGLRLKESRAAAGMSQQALAQALGVSLASVTSWERGVYVPSANAVPRLASALNLHRLEDLYVTVDGHAA